MLATATLLLVLHGSPLTLDEAIGFARSHHPDLRQSRSQHDTAVALADEARAPLFPQVTATASYRRTTANRVLRVGTDPRVIALQPSATGDLYNLFNFGVTVTQVIYDFGQSTGSLAAANATAEAASQTERTTEASVDFGVRTAFLVALAEKRLVGVAQQMLENQRQHLAQVEAFVGVKQRPEIDLAQARLDVANAEVDVINKENDYEIAKARLNQAMGQDEATDYDVAEASVPPVRGELEVPALLLDEAVRARPELASLRKQAEAQEHLVRAAKGAYGPTLTVSANASEAGTELDHLRWNYYGQVALSWNVFQGMLTPARVRQAESLLHTVAAKEDALRQNVKLEIEQARLGVRATRSALAVAERAADFADDRLRLAQGRYRAGVGNALEVGDAMVARSAAAAQRIRAEYLLSTARAELLRALGRSTPEH